MDRIKSRSTSTVPDKTKFTSDMKYSVPPSIPKPPSPLIHSQKAATVLSDHSSPPPLPSPPPQLPTLSLERKEASNVTPVTADRANTTLEHNSSSLASPKGSGNEKCESSGLSSKKCVDDNSQISPENEQDIIKKYLEEKKARTTVDLSLHSDEFYLRFGKRVFSLLLQPSELHLFLSEQADIVKNEFYSSSSYELQPPSFKRRK